MESLKPVERLRERAANAVSELAEADEKLAGVSREWQDVLVAGNKKGEAAVSARMDKAKQERDVIARLPELLTSAITQAIKDALPEHGRETGEQLAVINAKAVTLATQMLEHFQAARTLAIQVMKLSHEHGVLVRDHRLLCKEVNSKSHIPFEDARCAVQTGVLESVFKPKLPKYDEVRWALNERTVFNKPIGETRDE